MRVYQLTEQPYYPAWNDHKGSLRVNLPNRKCDPKIAGDLFHGYYDEWQVARRYFSAESLAKLWTTEEVLPLPLATA